MDAPVTGHSLSFVGLFLQADSVVKTVMVLLALASVWGWAVILETFRRLWVAQRSLAPFETGAVVPLAEVAQRPVGAAQRVLAVGLKLVQQERGHAASLVRDHLISAMRVQLGREVRALDRRLPVLATISSSAPFIGLFGTVWGIMNSFTAIASARDTSLATVAPGIAEALLATAMGLVAAIPAVIGYNLLAAAIGRFSARSQAVIADAALKLTRTPAPASQEAA
ncbi:MotA/TolQ/ExbB proton channel family protein [Elstera cyanobacteriorum]|uniref:MotA/TolQ/ExbB proton channel family protein n=1 Tax=Elstera cyanobacteriorum TaxID=2022747 RepID=UPI002353B036|nr:MotA/TolQ/ExbB proton channel family protein [Elstera cyanobacteriorum]MCK6442497.1 MotA/TolQ/ExbB proton channel family protein [Elstera cyanobacteriorum]